MKSSLISNVLSPTSNFVGPGLDPAAPNGAFRLSRSQLLIVGQRQQAPRASGGPVPAERQARECTNCLRPRERSSFCAVHRTDSKRF